MRLFSVDRYIFSMKFPTGFTYRTLHCFARFLGDSTALVSEGLVNYRRTDYGRSYRVSRLQLSHKYNLQVRFYQLDTIRLVFTLLYEYDTIP